MELKTASGKSIHPIGIGTWGMGGERSSSKAHEEAEIKAIQYALSKGQNHIDTAEMYGDGYTDVIVGKAIKNFNRGDIFIADKILQRSFKDVETSVNVMLKRLGTEYIDLLYVHYPWNGWEGTIPQINKLITSKKVRHFGVSNFSIAQMKKAMTLSTVPIVANQIYFSVLYKREATKTMREFCKKENITIVAYKPIERGEVTKNKSVQAIAKAHGATPAQIALAWLLQKGSLPIPKATQKFHIDENFNSINIKLTNEELKKLN